MAGVRGIATIVMVGALCAAPAASAARARREGRGADRGPAAAQGLAVEGRAEARQPAGRRARAAREGRSIAPAASTGVRVSKSGSTLVDVRAPVTGDLLDRLKGIGAVVEHASRRVDSVRASIPLSAL